MIRTLKAKNCLSAQGKYASDKEDKESVETKVESKS